MVAIWRARHDSNLRKACGCWCIPSAACGAFARRGELRSRFRRQPPDVGTERVPCHAAQVRRRTREWGIACELLHGAATHAACCSGFSCRFKRLRSPLFWLSTLPPQPRIPTFGPASREKQEWAGNSGFSRVQHAPEPGSRGLPPGKVPWGRN